MLVNTARAGFFPARAFSFSDAKAGSIAASRGVAKRLSDQNRRSPHFDHRRGHRAAASV